MVNKVLELEEGTKIMVMAPVVKGEKGTHKDLFENLRKDGYIRVKVDGELLDLSEDIELSKTKNIIYQLLLIDLLLKII